MSQLVLTKRFGEPIYPTLVPVGRVNRGGAEKPWHMLINADNFYALQLLLYAYERQVDMIYIDPPYNSGARDWKYNNRYVDDSDSWKHSKWLSMMKKRLNLARPLLKPDGVLVITIDENEVHHLGMLLEQLLPGYLRQIVTIVINPKGAGKQNFARLDEYAMFCFPNTGRDLLFANRLAQGRLAQDEEDEELEAEDDSEKAEEQPDLELIDTAEWDRPFPPEEADQWEPRHARRRGNESSYRHQRPNSFYPIYIDESKRKVVRVGESLPKDAPVPHLSRKGLTAVWPVDEEGNHRCWRLVPESMARLVSESRVFLGRFNRKRRTWTLNLWVRKTVNKKVKTVWWNPLHDAGTHGTSLLHKILGRRDAFPFPKSVYAVRDTLATVCGNRPDALILDFFAGSGTTYEATCMLNAEDGGRRRSILVRGACLDILTRGLARLKQKEPDFTKRVSNAGKVAITAVGFDMGAQKVSDRGTTTVELTPENIDDLFESCGRDLGIGEGLHKEFWKAIADPEDPLRAKLELVEVLKTEDVRAELNDVADATFRKLFEKNRHAIVILPSSRLEPYNRLSSLGREPGLVTRSMPTELSMKKDGVVTKGHVYANKKGECVLTLNDWEREILKAEIARPDFVGWLRNIPRKDWAIAVPYEDRGLRSFYPDFVVVRKEKTDLVADLIEPHASTFDDTWCKIKGLAAFASRHPAAFGRLEFAIIEKGAIRRIDVNNPIVRAQALKLASNNDVDALFK